jgi:hypothetical protein
MDLDTRTLSKGLAVLSFARLTLCHLELWVALPMGCRYQTIRKKMPLAVYGAINADSSPAWKRNPSHNMGEPEHSENAQNSNHFGG